MFSFVSGVTKEPHHACMSFAEECKTKEPVSNCQSHDELHGFMFRRRTSTKVYDVARMEGHDDRALKTL